MATEYIFFDAGLRDRFLQFAAGLGLAGEAREDAMDAYVVALPDELADDVDEAVEAEYEALMDEQRALVDEADDGDARDLMGVAVTLPDGRPCMVSLPASIARRLYQHFDSDEIHELVTAIAEQAMNPSAGPICRRG